MVQELILAQDISSLFQCNSLSVCGMKNIHNESTEVVLSLPSIKSGLTEMFALSTSTPTRCYSLEIIQTTIRHILLHLNCKKRGLDGTEIKMYEVYTDNDSL